MADTICINCRHCIFKVWFLYHPDGSLSHGFCDALSFTDQNQGYELISLIDWNPEMTDSFNSSDFIKELDSLQTRCNQKYWGSNQIIPRKGIFYRLIKHGFMTQNEAVKLIREKAGLPPLDSYDALTLKALQDHDAFKKEDEDQ